MRLSALAFLAGIILLQTFAALPAPSLAWLGLPCLLLVLIRPFRLPAFFLLGFCWALFRAHLILQTSLPPELIKKDVQITGVIHGIPESRDHGIRFEFDIETLAYRGRTYPAPGRVRLNWYRNPRMLQAGERWRLTVRLKPPAGFANPGGFDYEGWLFQHRIRATGYVRHKGKQTYLGLSTGFAARLDRQRQALGRELVQISEAGPTRPLLLALTVGERDRVSPEQWAVLRATGTNHLLAISGLHIGLVAMLAFGLARRLWSLSHRAMHWLPAQQAGAVAAILAALGYAALAGFSIPTQRALIMVLAVMLGWLIRRRIPPGDSLALALLAVLLWDPLAVLAPGFWLSFVAVGLLFYTLAGPRKGLWARWGRAQWVIFLGLTPLLLFWFQQLSLLAPAVNLVAIPWVGMVVVPLLFLSLLLLPLSPGLAHGLLGLCQQALAALWWGLEGATGLPVTQWFQASPPWWAVLLAAMGALWLLLPRGVPARWLGLVWLLPALAAGPARLPEGSARLTLLDVGQGLSAVVQTRDRVLVFDTGPRYSRRFDTGEAVVLPYLRQMGIRRIDRLIVSHSDNDHIGGAASILAVMPVTDTLSSVPQLLKGARRCVAGEAWHWNGVAFRLLHPPAGFSRHRHSDNNRSCVLKVTTAGGSVLLPGDIERPAERYLLAHRRSSLHADVLVAPHHGSHSSSGPDFIDAVAPRYVFYPVGYLNRYHFPHRDVVRRYASRHIASLDTARNGAIMMTLGRGGAGTPRGYRQTARRYWQHTVAATP
jgi:competence protein ComEC